MNVAVCFHFLNISPLVCLEQAGAQAGNAIHALRMENASRSCGVELKSRPVTKFSSKKKTPSTISQLCTAAKRVLRDVGFTLNKVSAALVYLNGVSDCSLCFGNHDVCSPLNANVDANPVPSMLTLSSKLN